MSRFFSEKYKNLSPYTPGEQPKDTQYIKLNTNESPFPPSPLALSRAAGISERMNLYSDPECTELNRTLAELLGVGTDEVLAANGSDEILNFAFMAFCDSEHPAIFPNITYGFYPVAADLNGVPCRRIPLKDDFTIDVEDYTGIRGTIFIANPNAPTGIALSVPDIEKILSANPESVVVIDEAYVDFGAESCVPLIRKYDNLLVTQTFSKSRSLAGARLGFGVGCKALIQDLNAIKYSTNPYNVNMMTMAAGVGALEDSEYTAKNCEYIIETRRFTEDELSKLGFVFTNSRANFVFARHPKLDGKEIYLKLKEMGILVRHFDQPEISQYNRITIGTREQMCALFDALRKILEVS